VTAGFAGVDGVVGDVPGAAVNDERWLHSKKGWQRRGGLSSERKKQRRFNTEDAEGASTRPGQAEFTEKKLAQMKKSRSRRRAPRNMRMVPR
jgi:hypothetical protein